ncbi:hypothetical protein SCHPADRAFT_947342 [Schizopora paradoxa]|uniref:Uncharacterized protein n=1 Tax=Schizopora paradoxa TaxID=27342 RepID=A0A0H2QZU5_9AGAM|nr:hypothetical protein SCHPADRAFT_947342 [Schizopora paradoxa]
MSSCPRPLKPHSTTPRPLRSKRCSPDVDTSLRRNGAPRNGGVRDEVNRDGRGRGFREKAVAGKRLRLDAARERSKRPYNVEQRTSRTSAMHQRPPQDLGGHEQTYKTQCSTALLVRRRYVPTSSEMDRPASSVAGVMRDEGRCFDTSLRGQDGAAAGDDDRALQ